MEGLLILLLFPLAWPFVARMIWPREITWSEMGLNIGIIAVLVTGLWYTGRYGKMSDTEIWNGEVRSKQQTYVSCEHSYSCNCTTTCSGSGTSRTCSQVCQTCYEHSNDWDWNVYTTAGNFTVDRIDRRGSHEPPRWTKVKLGDPVAREHSFVNYIKAAPDSLFHARGNIAKKYPGLLPTYPSVYDYQYADRVISLGLSLPQKVEWNKKLALALRKLGPGRQANAIVVVVKNPDQAYVHALEAHWLGGKKNDIVVVLGVPEYPKISWAYVMSWTKAELFKVELRDALLTLEHIDDTPIIETIEQYIQKSFVRRHMSEFEYLKDEIDPPTWVIVLAVIFAVGGSLALTYLFHRNGVNDYSY